MFQVLRVQLVSQDFKEILGLLETLDSKDLLVNKVIGVLLVFKAVKDLQELLDYQEALETPDQQVQLVSLGPMDSKVLLDQLDH